MSVYDYDHMCLYVCICMCMDVYDCMHPYMHVRYMFGRMCMDVYIYDIGA